MTIEYVPREPKQPTNQLVLVISTSTNKHFEKLSSSYEIVHGNVKETVKKTQKTGPFYSTAYVLEFEDGAKVRYLKNNWKGKQTQRDYVCRDGKIFYTEL